MGKCLIIHSVIFGNVLLYPGHGWGQPKDRKSNMIKNKESYVWPDDEVETMDTLGSYLKSLFTVRFIPLDSGAVQYVSNGASA